MLYHLRHHWLERHQTHETSTSGDPDNPDIHILTDDNNDIDSDDGKPSVKRLRVSDLDIENIVMGVELSDVHINLAQRILKQQFPELNGFPALMHVTYNFHACLMKHAWKLHGRCMLLACLLSM